MTYITLIVGLCLNKQIEQPQPALSPPKPQVKPKLQQNFQRNKDNSIEILKIFSSLPDIDNKTTFKKMFNLFLWDFYTREHA